MPQTKPAKAPPQETDKLTGVPNRRSTRSTKKKVTPPNETGGEFAHRLINHTYSANSAIKKKANWTIREVCAIIIACISY